MKKIVVFLLLFFLFVPAWSQDAEAIQKQAQKQRRPGKVFLNFQNADISLVVREDIQAIVEEIIKTIDQSTQTTEDRSFYVIPLKFNFILFSFLSTCSILKASSPLFIS